MGEDEEKKTSIARIFLIFFGVIALISFIFSLISLVYHTTITGSVIGGIQKNTYNLVFFLIFLLFFIFLEVLISMRKKRREVDISELVKEARKEG
jgi:uncharacterized membrane protein